MDDANQRERQIKWLTEYTAIKGFVLEMATKGMIMQYKALAMIEILDKRYGKYVPKKPHGNTKLKPTA